ncbi:hypothetical protein MMC30_003763 [Trapelia coarctata]|nr:hypothetical protein [Trapelia coarctata]
MFVPQEAGRWDLTPVVNLVYALSANEDDQKRGQSLWAASFGEERIQCCEPRKEQEAQLGNFDEIWRFLGQPLDVPPPIVAPRDEVHEVQLTVTESGTENVNGKTVRWHDDVESEQLKDSDSENKLPNGTTGPLLTKAQRKKAARRLRKNPQASAPAVSNVLSSSSDDNFDVKKESLEQRSKDRRSIIQQIINGQQAEPIIPVQPQTLPGNKVLQRNKALQDVINSTLSTSANPLMKAVFAPVFVPRQVPVYDDALAIAAAKKKTLMLKLNTQFVDERQFLQNISLVQHPPNGAEVPLEGIHVFVDISNILIGFHDALKMARGLSISTRIRRQPLSFHNLSLILERGRPAAKRVLVGSDNYESIQEARLIGYETNILDRVHKAKELTPRQKKYNALSGQSSGSETGPTHAPEKWVEQAVDEILHLKILESVVDAKEPSTIVLATGDAAEAEYSGGFLKMVERALEKGWRVELVSFRHNTSGAYRKREFRSKWGMAFKTIELDEFAEELLGA